MRERERLGSGHVFTGGRKTLCTSQRRDTISLASYYRVGGVNVGSKSVRLGADLERDLRSAAEVLGVPESELIRQAVAERCRQVLSDRLDVRLADYVGVVSRGGGRAQATGQAFRDVLNERRSSRS